MGREQLALLVTAAALLAFVILFVLDLRTGVRFPSGSLAALILMAMSLLLQLYNRKK